MQSVSATPLSNFKNTVSNVLKVFSIFTWIKEYQNDKKLMATANEYIKQMAALEMKPIKEGDCDALLSRVKELTHEIHSRRRTNLVATECLLTRHLIAQEARRKSIHTHDETHYDLLADYASKWKARQKYFVNNLLSDRDKAKLKEACQYDGFTQILLSDPKAREEFFQWTILNDSRVCPFHPNNVEVFVKFPGLHQEILRKLHYRSSRFGGDLFQVDQETQTLTLPLEGKRVKVLQDAKFEMKGHLGLGKMIVTFKEIFRELHKKISYDGDGEFEITNQSGIWLWNAKRLGFYDADKNTHRRIDLDKEGWFHQLPTVETLTCDEASRRYRFPMLGLPDGYKDLKYQGLSDDVHPLYNLAGTQKEEYDLLGTHAYDVLLLVNRTTNTVEVKSIGHFLYPFPKGTRSLILSMPVFAPSYMYSPDENMFNANRKHAGDYSIPPVMERPDPQKWMGYLQDLKRDIQRGWQDKLPFNFFVANCTSSAWELGVRNFGMGNIPDLRLNFWKMSPQGPVGKVYGVLKTMPERVTKLFFFLLGSWRWMHAINEYGQEVTYSLLKCKHPFKYLVHPAGLFKPIEPGRAFSV
jgi:hypothetical protein